MPRSNESRETEVMDRKYVGQPIGIERTETRGAEAS